ncbi:DNA mismatch repair protein MSH2 [Trypanosoma grayi]|uniref:DNA mismatch repair protein MSH2 n=1 Tax=Trypanosoma grayi TaxID=71804 RepID=UPI0004F4615A|nr:DNA mismatch repair protein MSH2 [Trypanosoma grayi]KEG11549.1 DNA mismatch repair protein MSH2 [Trypanosoma grayi]
MQPVEHVRIGKHVFPRYSHPLFRSKLHDEAYVQQQIERQLQNPQLQLAVNEAVEQLLRQGVTGSISEEDTAAYFEKALGSLDVFFAESTSRASTPASVLADQVSCTFLNSSPAPAVRPSPPRVRRFFPAPHCSRVALPTGVPSLQLRGLEPLRKTQLRLPLQKKQQKHDAAESSIDEATPGPVTLTRRQLLPCSEVDECDRNEMLSLLPELKHDANKGHKRQGPSSLQLTVSAPPEWRDAVRSLFYSMLSLRVEESGGVQPSEMDLRSGAQGLLRLQGAELTSLNREAFGALDVTLDGNSTAIHCRPKAPPSIFQRSHAQQAERGFQIKPSVLRQRAMKVVVSPSITTCTPKENTGVGGASLKHSWASPSLATVPTLLQGATELELPSTTCRSRVLASILMSQEKQRQAGLGKEAMYK